MGSHRPFRTPLFPGKFLESKNAADPLISERISGNSYLSQAHTPDPLPVRAAPPKVPHRRLSDLIAAAAHMCGVGLLRWPSFGSAAFWARVLITWRARFKPTLILRRGSWSRWPPLQRAGALAMSSPLASAQCRRRRPAAELESGQPPCLRGAPSEPSELQVQMRTVPRRAEGQVQLPARSLWHNASFTFRLSKLHST